MRLPKRIAAAACLLAWALVFPACGKSSNGQPAESVPPALPPSIEEFERAVEQGPDDPVARHDLAMALHQAGRREEALPHFEKLAELRPESIHLVELGVAYASLGRMEQAEDAFERALEPAPDDPIALHHLGNIARGRGNAAEAISLYRQALENDPAYLMVHFHLAEAQLQAGQIEEAYRSYEQVVRLQPKEPAELAAFDASLLRLATIDLQMGATERAVEFLRVLVDSVPDHPQAHLLLGQALIKLGQNEAGQQELRTHQELAGRQPRPAPAAAGSSGRSASAP